MAKALTLSPPARATTGCTLTASPKARANTNGNQAKSTLEISSKVKSTAKENGKALKLCQTVTNMKATIKMMPKMEKVFSHGPVGISTRVIMSAMRGMGMGKCSGQTAACMKESGKEASSTESAASFFPMGRSKKDILRIMCINIHFRLEVSKHKCVQRRRAQGFNQIHIAKIPIS